MRRSKSANRGSDHRLSNLGVTLRSEIMIARMRKQSPHFNLPEKGTGIVTGEMLCD
jgi:hypothetical protein